MKIFLDSGEEEYILFHIEIQGYKQKNFQERMFAYYIRIWDRYRKPVTSLAIVTVPFNKTWFKNNTYEIESFGTRLSYKYDLIDLAGWDYKDCLQSGNPVKVALSILIPDKGPPRWRRKAEAIKNLVELGLSPEDIHLTISFIDRLLPLNKKELEKFTEFTVKNYKEVNVILTTYEEKGIEKGIKKGIKKGKLEDAKRMIEKSFSIEDIIYVTGLSKKEVLDLIKKTVPKTDFQKSR